MCFLFKIHNLLIFYFQIVAGLYYPTEWFGDARKFAVQMAAACSDNGVEFKYNTSVLSVIHDGE
jgi:glycine/D-amino acid oxidase-like deaminating enzyme